MSRAVLACFSTPRGQYQVKSAVIQNIAVQKPHAVLEHSSRPVVHVLSRILLENVHQLRVDDGRGHWDGRMDAPPSDVVRQTRWLRLNDPLGDASKKSSETKGLLSEAVFSTDLRKQIGHRI